MRSIGGRRGLWETKEILPRPRGQRLLTHQLFPSEDVGPSSLKDPEFQVKSHNVTPLMTLHKYSTSETQERKSVVGLEEASCHVVSCSIAVERAMQQGATGCL